MKKQELVQLIKENFTNSEGNIDISNLDFGDFEGGLFINGIKSKGNVYQDHHFNKVAVWQYWDFNEWDFNKWHVT